VGGLATRGALNTKLALRFVGTELRFVSPAKVRSPRREAWRRTSRSVGTIAMRQVEELMPSPDAAYQELLQQRLDYSNS